MSGSPQPELKSFVIGTANGPASATTDGFNGNLDIAYEISTANTDGAIVVCVLKRGARTCASKTTLFPEDDSTVRGSPFVITGGSDDVWVSMDECCTANDLLFESTDGGKSFGSPVPLGTGESHDIEVAEAFGVGPNEYWFWAEDDAGGTFPVDIAPSDNLSGQIVTAMTDSKGNDFFTAGLGRPYNGTGGVIATASDSNDVTFASFALVSSMVFHKVGRYAGQQLIATSGQALVTQLTSGSQSLVLRLFNGTSFGAAHVVPHTGGGGPQWDTAYEDPQGQTFIFTERNQDGYDLEMQSTTSGTAWTARTDMGSAIKSSEFSPAISDGSGLVVGTSGPVTVWPVLVPQTVSFTLSRSTVEKGATVTAEGKGSSPMAGRTVQLEQLVGHAWRGIALTHELANGSFAFKISGLGVGTYTFRAYSQLLPGYLQYGYSPSRTLTVVKSKG